MSHDSALRMHYCELALVDGELRRLLSIRTLLGMAAGLAVLAIVLACILVFPSYIAAMDAAGTGSAATAQARNSVRTTLLQGIGGITLLIGAYVTWRQSQNHRQATLTEQHLAREGQITERLSRAVNQLASGDLSVRLGGIHTLERIVRESESDGAAIAAILAAFVRSRAALKSLPPVRPVRTTPLPWLGVRAPDVQAALTVLGRSIPRTIEPDPIMWTTLDLSGTDLRRSRLDRCDLRRVRMYGANLSQANLSKADLRGSDLRLVDLTGAILTNAVEDASTWWPAGFDARAAGVIVSADTLDLRGANLSQRDLTGMNLAGAIANTSTRWPADFDWRVAGVVLNDG